MSELYATLSDWFQSPTVRAGVRAALILLVAILFARLVRRRVVGDLTSQERLLASRVLGTIIYGVAIAWALSELGLSISVLLGAAGVLTIAFGFAAQTAVSNLISGLFLIVERPFKLTDIISVGASTGEVVAIDLMSTKLRTFNNLLVRIPNEVLLKAEVTNLTHFPIRRVDVGIRLPERTDLAAFLELFDEIAHDTPGCLDEPRPGLLIDGFDEAGVVIRLIAWAATPDFQAVKNALQRQVTAAVAAEAIVLAVPQRKNV